MDLRNQLLCAKGDQILNTGFAQPAFEMLIEFLGGAKLHTPGAGGRSWPVAPVSRASFARRMPIVMQDTARDPSVRFGARQLSLRANRALVRARGMAAENACRAEGA
jgi:hypothetical protein